MLKKFCSLFLPIILSSCAAEPRKFEAIDNCVVVTGNIGNFSCVDKEAKSYTLDWFQSEDLVCFHQVQFKSYNEICHGQK